MSDHHHGHHAHASSGRAADNGTTAVDSHPGQEQHSGDIRHDHPQDHTGEHGHHQHGGPAGHSGHGDHGDHVGQFRTLFWIMLALGIPVVGFNEMFAHLVGYQLPAAEWVWWVSPVQ